MSVEHDNMPSAPHGEGVQQAEPDAPVKGSVGALLQASRIRLGIDLGMIADTLRIRRVYLEAIEEGRYEDLPGGTYAVGFIRSYAEQLGLDPLELVRRFKLETAGEAEPEPQPVAFPKPVKTLGLPIGAIVTGIVVAAALVAVGWYLFSGTERTSLLPRIPAALNEKVGSASPAPEADKPAAPEAAPAPEAEKPAVEAEKPAVVPPPEPAKAEPPKPEPTKPAEPVKPVKPAPQAEAPKPAAAAPKAVEQPKPVTAKPAEPPKPAAAPKPAEPPKPVAAAPKAVEPPPPAAEAAGDVPETPEAVPREPRVYGAENGDARVEIVATGESWVQVTENGTLVLTRLLHAGDRFKVPNRPGLRLMTGNAGGLDVVVDGAKARPIGTAGQVMRDVALDPDRLRAGH